MILDSFRLEGKNAFVTKSVEGLDAAAALAKAKAGASVANRSPGHITSMFPLAGAIEEQRKCR
jgi:hypothetical protein